jgi:glycine/D-amino acid oxidase-like deaminating enzyme/nitrite reductase/ring-hydroxylating ferredoxin subunit
MHDRSAPASTPFEPGARRDVVIEGAGLTGLSTALMLARDGLDVAVVEADDVAARTSGANTGKLSLLQGDRLALIARHHPASLVRGYVEANRTGQDWLLAFAGQAGVPYTRTTDYAYAQGAAGVGTLRAQHTAARGAGLDARMLAAGDVGPIPFPVAGAVALDDQAMIDPVRVVDALARAFLDAGGTLHSGVRVTGARARPETCVHTAAGPLFARHIVLATGTPILDRGLYFAKVRGLRSSCVSFRLPPEAAPLAGSYISVDGPTRSIRPVSPGDGPADLAQLIVGGNGYPVGRADSEAAELDDLVAWAREHFPGAEETHRWSAQDYESHNLIPFAGALPRGLGRIRFATGFAKWGLTNAPAAALRIATEIRGTRWRDRPRWMIAIGTRITVPADLGRGMAENSRVGGHLVGGWVDAAARRTPVARPAEGQGVVAHRAGCPVAISTVDGVTRAVSAVCTHVGGVLEWNDAECTWDCPLHASRFAADGTRIEGPAVRDLRRLR